MCFSSKVKTPEAAAPAAPAVPSPTPSEPMATQANAKKQMDKFRYGLASTVKTGPRGISGSGSDLMGNQNNLKTKLGA